jgi:glutamyl-tRNA reductase
MSIVVIGINHRTSPLALLEKVAVSEAMLPKALHGLSVRDNIREVVLLATCNRTEVYAVAEKFHGAYGDIRDFFAELSGLDPDDLHPHLYSQHDDAAVTHLFDVTAGLDSAVLGETEILGQVRDAWNVALSEGASRTTLNLLFRHALEVGKRARTETGISRSTASVSHAAVEMANEILGTVTGKRVLVVGAGVMGDGVATALSRAGATDVTVVNRTHDRGVHLADKVGASVIPFEELPQQLAQSDVVVTCTGAGDVIITKDFLHEARSTFEVASPLLIVDIAMPRDVDSAVTEINGVVLRDMHDLGEWAARGAEQRSVEATEVRRIVAEEVERFTLDNAARQAAPLVAQLREQIESIREGELDRFAQRLATLSPEQREIVESLTHGIVAKILHTPSVHLKQAAGTPQGERLSAAVRDLFNLH